MQSKTSFINKGLLYNDFKRFGWMGAAYLLAWLAAVPLQLIMIHSRPEIMKVYYNADTYLRVFLFDHNAVSLFMLLGAPVIAGLLLFRYLQTDKTADMEHSWPVKRGTIYNTHLMTGLIFLWGPVIITALVTWAVATGMGMGFVQGHNIFNWLKVAMMGNLLLYLSTVAVGMITGLSALQGVLTYILLLVPTGLTALILHNLEIHVFGFAYDYYMVNLDRLSPLLALPYSLMKGSDITIYLLISLALYLAGGYLYRRRPSETAGEAITIRALRPLLKYSVTFCTMLLLGSYFYSTQQSLPWTFFGYLLGAFLGYTLTEILFNKSVHIFTRQGFKGLGIYTLAVLGLFMAVKLDIVGFENRLPDVSQIKDVYMDSSFYPLRPAGNGPAAGMPKAFVYGQVPDIANILALHREIIAQKQESRFIPIADRNIRQERVCLAYHLKNGRHILRYYAIDPTLYAGQLKPIYESLEYKNHRYGVLQVNPGDVKLIDIRSQAGNKRVTVTDPTLIQQAVKVLQEDIESQSYEAMTSNSPPWGSIDLALPGAPDANGVIRPKAAAITGGPMTDTFPAMPGYAGAMGVTVDAETGLYCNYSVSWQKSYSGFAAWLKQTGLYEQARLLPGRDIVHAIIKYYPGGMSEPEFRLMRSGKDPGEKRDQLKIQDPDQIELCLLNYQEVYTAGSIYTVSFQLKDGGRLFGILIPSVAPDFLTEI